MFLVDGPVEAQSSAQILPGSYFWSIVHFLFVLQDPPIHLIASPSPPTQFRKRHQPPSQTQQRLPQKPQKPKEPSFTPTVKTRIEGRALETPFQIVIWRWEAFSSAAGQLDRTDEHDAGELDRDV